ncbi:MAG: glutaredoxin family protein [Thermovirgaceae bacterium]|nr:glutaredoxin family protein [Thermovirgaceae bacterium]
MIEKNHVAGENRGEILVYALSTCGWCRKTKEHLRKMGLAFDYIDVDLLDPAESEEVMETVRKHNEKGSFPTIIVNDEHCVVGYDMDRLRELLKDE